MAIISPELQMYDIKISEINPPHAYWKMLNENQVNLFHCFIHTKTANGIYGVMQCVMQCAEFDALADFVDSMQNLLCIIR